MTDACHDRREASSLLNAVVEINRVTANARPSNAEPPSLRATNRPKA
jgi:hypothetical protein